MDRADDLLATAIANTETEIFSEATGKDLPSTEGGPGDRSVEEMGTGLEGQLEAEGADQVEAGDEGETDQAGSDGADDAAGTESDGKGKPAQDPATGKFVSADDAAKAKVEPGEQPVDPKARVPLSELMTERKARQALQKALDDEKAGRTADKAAAQTEFEKLNARVDQLYTQPRTPAQPTQPSQTAPRKPDIFEDPEAFVADLRNELQSDMTKKYVNADFARTHKQHGDSFLQAFTAITNQAKTDPAAAAESQKILTSATPGDDLMAWHKRQEALRVVGEDPAAYTARIEAETREKLLKDPELRKQIVAELRGEVGQQSPGQRQQQQPSAGTPRQVFRMPKSLNGASGGQLGGQTNGSAPIDGSDRGVFDAAFADQ